MWKLNATLHGLIDATLMRCCRPIVFQQSMYNGHKRAHGLKLQSIVCPDGMIGHLFGPVRGKDMAQLSFNIQVCCLYYRSTVLGTMFMEIKETHSCIFNQLFQRPQQNTQAARMEHEDEQCTNCGGVGFSFYWGKLGTP